ncbi:MAG: hypothetical protein Q7S33_02570 [Nanoarchaeota archaeon]|nr:hypothetical protein [Nanoarchaeota archaeon]
MVNLEKILRHILGKEETHKVTYAKNNGPRDICPYKTPAQEKKKDSSSFLTHQDYDCISCSGYNKHCERYSGK